MFGMLPVLARLHEATGDKVFQPFRKNVWSDLKGALEFREPRETAENRVPQDEDAPALANKLQSPRRRTILIFI